MQQRHWFGVVEVVQSVWTSSWLSVGGAEMLREEEYEAKLKGEDSTVMGKAQKDWVVDLLVLNKTALVVSPRP